MRALRTPTGALVLALTVLGAVIRVRVAGQSGFADELSTHWIVLSHGLGDVVSIVHTDAEITPPLFFVLSWLTTRLGHSTELLRLPSLLAGTAAIPVVHAIGARTVGRRAGLLAAALLALSPFMVFYSAEARGYELMIALVMFSTYALLRGADGGRRGWWALYAFASCGAMYTHYTAAFALAAQLGWLLVARPAARRPALIANAAAVLGFLPWTTGLINDLTSPTTKILSKLEPFTLHAVGKGLGHWAIGTPYAFETSGLRALPGTIALMLLALGVVLGAAAGAPRIFAARRRVPAPVILVLLLALSVPVGEAILSAFGTNLFGVRNLAAAWPYAALALAALLGAPGPRVRLLATACVVACFAIAAVKMLEPRFGRIDYGAAARQIDREAAPGDVVLDRAVLTPGPLGPLDVRLSRPHPLLRAGRPQERDHPFTTLDPVPPLAVVDRRAVARAAGRRIFVVSLSPVAQVPVALTVLAPLPGGYRRTATRTYPGVIGLNVSVYERAASPPG